MAPAILSMLVGGGQYYMFHVLTAPAAPVPLKHPLSHILLCYWSSVKATHNDASWSYRETMKRRLFTAGLRQPFKRRQVTIPNIICSTLKPNSSLEYRKEPSNRLRILGFGGIVLLPQTFDPQSPIY